MKLWLGCFQKDGESMLRNDNQTTHPWSLDKEVLLSNFHSDPDLGLGLMDVERNLAFFGDNVLKEEVPDKNVVLFFRQFKNPMALTLLCATIVSSFFGETHDAMAIFAILILNGFIGFFQEKKSNDAILSLKKLSVPKVRVIRGGKVFVTASEKVVPGDILQIEAGDYVVADARVIEAFQLTSDESSLTGESFPIEKVTHSIPVETILSERINMLHAGTAVSGGSGKALVTSTGMKTQIGKVAQLLTETHQELTPLQIRLNGVSLQLLYMGFLVILIVVFLRYLENDPWQEILMSAIGLSIAAIPEGLPTVIIVALAIAIKRMTKRHVIIRNLSAVETLGSTDVICTDKTGTLTTGKMKVRDVHPHKVSDFERLIEGFVLCNNASIQNSGSGDPTERSLLQYAADKNFSVEDLKARFPRIKEWSFDSERKKMSVAVKDLKEFRIITKGAPEELISSSRLSEEEKNMYLKKVHLLSSKGVRVLALGEKKKVSLDVHSNDLISIERDLEFLGMVAISDPPKEESISSVRACKEAGIKVIMITGDHPSTALGVARELGILNPGEPEVVLTGKDLDCLDDETLRQKVEATLVYARVSPFHKLRIVECLQINHHVVAMTGDGVNDAPALKKAQIGVAMGKGGTEVARQASSMILTDDNFSSIVSAVKEGRAIYGNIKRTIQYLLSTNLSEILIVLGASLLNLPLPFTPLGLLWINFVTDGPPSLALASEPVDETILIETRRPSPKTFFDKRFLWEIFLIGFLMTIIGLGVYYYSYQNEGEVKAKSYVFTLLVFMTLFRSFSCRSETKSFFQLKMNYYHLFSVLLPILIQYTMDHLEFYQRVFQVQELTLSDNTFLMALGLIPFILVELFKLEKKRQKIEVSDQ